MRLKSLLTRETGVVLLILIVAAFVRCYQLTAVPSGLHGDEAVPAIEAQRILEQGYIGPYSPLALGQPAGPMYFLAPYLKLLGNTIATVRTFAAISGVLTVLLFYCFVRQNSGRKMAVAAALLLALSGWHIHFSRIGFPLIAWPFHGILAVMVLAAALRRNDWRWWAGAGAAAGIGVYSYNAHLLFIAVLLLFCLWYLVAVAQAPARERVVWLLAYGAGIALLALPLMSYIANPAHDYFSHARYLSIFEQPEWKALARPGPKLGFLLGRYFDFWDIMAFHPQLDYGDGTGIVPVLSPLLLALAVAGMAVAWRRREPIWVCAGLIVLLMPFASVITTAGQARRTFVLLPFLLMFAALAVVTLYNYLEHRTSSAREAGEKPFSLMAAAAPGLLIIILAWQSLSGYFGAFARAPEQATIFAAEFTDAVQWMKTLPPESYVYLCSDAIPFNHETRRYLAPKVRGEDRASRFNAAGFQVEREKGAPIFIFIGVNKGKLDEVRRLYPRGETIDGKLTNQPSFVAYRPAL